MARLHIALLKTTSTLGFLHAALLRFDNLHILIAGPSGSGKTTVAEQLRKDMGASILANDWVAVEQEANRLYVSDLNFASQMKHRHRCPLATVILLSKRNKNSLDTFIPSFSELKRLLADSFEAHKPGDTERLSAFWLEAIPYTFYAAVPTSPASEQRTAGTIKNLLLGLSRPQPPSIGIIGTGMIGSRLAWQLSQSDIVDQLHLFSPDSKKVLGLTMDISHAKAKTTQPEIIPHRSPKPVFQNSNIVFLCFRSKARNFARVKWDRWKRLSPHLKIIKKYAELVGQIGYQGLTFVITNPVDVLTYALYHFSQTTQHPLRTHQIYGIGLELDASRAAWHADRLGYKLRASRLRLWGNHSDRFWLETGLGGSVDNQLAELTRASSAHLRHFIERPTYGPVGAVQRVLDAYLNNGAVHLTTVTTNSHIGQWVQFNFGLPKFWPLPSKAKELIEWNRQRIRAFGLE
ncbi:hypothetical protein HY441_02555 [Candidatus Microgenomates bacterium]|nr:hypothetical protein [Candidatus Microgenomates bacterium]